MHFHLADEPLASASSPTIEARLPSDLASPTRADESDAGIYSLIYPYERLKVLSSDPATGIDLTKREVHLLCSYGECAKIVGTVCIY